MSRDEWMVIERALQDRIAVLEDSQGFGAGTLRFHEVEECKRLRKIISDRIATTYKPPSEVAA